MKTLYANQLKVNDRLIRRDDHLGRHDHVVTINGRGPVGHGTVFLSGYFRDRETTRSLCAQGYRIVERDGIEIGSFFQKYW